MFDLIITFFSEVLVGVSFDVIESKYSNSGIRFIAKSIIVLFYVCIMGLVFVSVFFQFISLLLNGELLLAAGLVIGTVACMVLIIVIISVYMKRRENKR